MDASSANQMSCVLYGDRARLVVLHYLITMEQTEEASLEEVSIGRILLHTWLTSCLALEIRAVVVHRQDRG